ncbi:MAG: FAD-dependent monooxygenase, partial [Chloroflexota bacterium]|nr:FAD-dependent monooxygenase [Chloroflexota bacterium]
MYDVVVVGGGPGGSAAAAALAHAGLSVLMLDRRGLVDGAYQQLKPCGGGMDGAFFHHLPPQTTKGEAVEALSEHQVYSLVTHTPHGPTGEIKTTGEPILHLGMRTRIDGFLARKAVECGAAYVQDRVARVRPAPGGFVVVGARNEYGAKWVVGADGAYGVTGRSLGLAPKVSVYLASEWECETDLQTWGRWEGKSLIEPSVAPFGYGWIFPKRPGHLSIGWGLPFRMGRRLNAMTANLFREHGISG